MRAASVFTATPRSCRGCPWPHTTDRDARRWPGVRLGRAGHQCDRTGTRWDTSRTARWLFDLHQFGRAIARHSFNCWTADSNKLRIVHPVPPEVFDGAQLHRESVRRKLNAACVTRSQVLHMSRAASASRSPTCQHGINSVSAQSAVHFPASPRPRPFSSRGTCFSSHWMKLQVSSHCTV